MKEKLNSAGQIKQTKIEFAKALISSILSRIPSDVKCGLREYGLTTSTEMAKRPNYDGLNDRMYFNPLVDCRMTALLVPVVTKSRKEISGALQYLKPVGMSPLEFTLRKACEEDLTDIAGRSVIMLISDGADTCGGDPARFIKSLNNPNLSFVVISLVERDRSARKALSSIAQYGRGKYYDGVSPDTLLEDLKALQK